MIGATPLSFFVILRIRVMTTGKTRAVGRAKIRDQVGGVVDVGRIVIGSGTTFSLELPPGPRKMDEAITGDIDGVA